jgi:protein-tyrosine-phosphatase
MQTNQRQVVNMNDEDKARRKEERLRKNKEMDETIRKISEENKEFVEMANKRANDILEKESKKMSLVYGMKDKEVKALVRMSRSLEDFGDWHSFQSGSITCKER